ncbi:hypothetical protein PEPMIC_00223 [Parvimonas micra ATCC 33270]|uniref:Uncharacterized protein n=1 Tax=Parvimonas micra ATCC 33270 TaxID=411465 RepID=A8SIW3_9FIRM|nr:hypothetical protein PEPMIC_00223 [Parvimonas micra ATCC 33270]
MKKHLSFFGRCFLFTDFYLKKLLNDFSFNSLIFISL